MSIDLINGLPGHPLFVHGAVAMVPLTALALVASAVWLTVAHRFGWLLPVLGAVSLALVVITTDTGEWLEEHVRETPLVKEHAEMGEDLTPWAIGLFVLTLAVWWIARTAARSRAAGAEGAAVGTGIGARLASTPVRIAVLILSLAVAVGAILEVIEIGDSGATAVWQGKFSTRTGD